MMHYLRKTEVWMALLISGILVVLLALLILFWDCLHGAESVSTTIRNLGLVFAAIIAFPLALWRSIVAQRQAETAQRDLLNERYQKGAEMLGNDLLTVRLGGIYALARLAHEHTADYHLQIMSLLCAFARNPPPPRKEEKETPDSGWREDVHEIVAAIRDRSEAQIDRELHEKYSLDLAEANLARAVLDEASLINANFLYANLTDASLCEATLAYALLADANLKKADLHLADLTGAMLKDCKGLTQEQLDQAIANEDEPPDLKGAVDAKTGDPLVWRGRSVDKGA